MPLSRERTLGGSPLINCSPQILTAESSTGTLLQKGERGSEIEPEVVKER